MKPRDSGVNQRGMAFDKDSITQNTSNDNAPQRIIAYEKSLVFKKMLLGKDFRWPYKFLFEQTRILFDYAGSFRKDNKPSIDGFINYLQQPYANDTDLDNKTVLDAVGGESFVREVLRGLP